MQLNISSDNWIKVAKGALIAAAATAMTYISQHLTGLDFGPYTPVVVGTLSVLVNYVRKLLEENHVQPPTT